ncbi:PadR family transcriptional regulator [Roseomonas sp. GC11]|uniref:PadR family transcriptional regulator n=1 Tax=Roseomonas sp. GC11 TaxID=2950546 RepID=UPI0021089EC7|nr:PadR family transcriptional regulator [Roseomonas sp. GC11]MCQ4160529.1 PadR family transcriptional regulator [Roseomonas sp. GC11]
MTPVRRAPSPRVDYASRDYWAGTIKMGLSKFFILRVLHNGPLHGYDIARLVERTTNGCCSPTEGTIYPVLREFEAGGFVTATEEVVGGRQRRVYALTDAGRAAFRVALEAWMEATAALQDTGRAFATADRARAEQRSGGACCT